MTIKLIGTLHPELTSLGLKPGDEIHATPDQVGKAGAMYFQVNHRSGITQNCVVWPDNYEIVKK